jgi:DNA-binding NarL/FixJ family response regulator
MARARILDVGQCSVDHGSISRFLGSQFGAEVTRAFTADEALDRLRSGAFDLVLVNRIGDRDGAPGVDLIRAIKADPAFTGISVMLVSNYPEAQAEAVDLGALRGFGKAELKSPGTQTVLSEALKSTSE